MTLEAECALSFYQEITSLDQKNKVMLVKHTGTGDIYVKKQLAGYCLQVYEQLKGLDIAGIPKVYEAIPDGDSLYVIEEYIHGHNLNQIYDERGNFSEDEVKSIALNLCSILTNIHDLTPPIIHRDIKPSNLILTSDGHLKLIDFDAAKIVNDDKGKDTHLLGTDNFAAPEQYGFGASDCRTDIYGVGSTINYLLTGKYPSEGLCDGFFQSIIKKCLEVDVSARYQSASELFAAIDDPAAVSKNADSETLMLGDISAAAIGKKRFLPVGFRTMNPLRMTTAILAYVLFLYLSLDFEGQLPLENLTWVFIVLASAAWFGNYLGIRDFLKIMPSRATKIISIILLWLVFFIAGFFFIVLVFPL